MLVSPEAITRLLVNALRKSGYRVELEVPVSRGRIDMVVSRGNGRAVVVEVAARANLDTVIGLWVSSWFYEREYGRKVVGRLLVSGPVAGPSARAATAEIDVHHATNEADALAFISSALGR